MLGVCRQCTRVCVLFYFLETNMFSLLNMITPTPPLCTSTNPMITTRPKKNRKADYSSSLILSSGYRSLSEPTIFICLTCSLLVHHKCFVPHQTQLREREDVGRDACHVRSLCTDQPSNSCRAHVSGVMACLRRPIFSRVRTTSAIDGRSAGFSPTHAVANPATTAASSAL